MVLFCNKIRLSKKYEQQSLNKEKSDDEEENFAHKSQNMICLPYESLQHFQQFHQYQQQQQQQPIGLGLPQLLPQLPQLPQQQPQLQQLIPQRPTINEQQRPATNEQLPTTTLQQPLQEHQSLEKTEDQSINVEEFKSLLACMKELKQQQTLCGLNGRFGLNIE